MDCLMRDPPPTLKVAGSQLVATILVKTNESLLSETKTTEPGRQRTSYFAK